MTFLIKDKTLSRKVGSVLSYFFKLDFLGRIGIVWSLGW